MSKYLYVMLEVGGDIEVRFDRDVWGDSKMRWRRDDDSVDFDFVSITGLPVDVFETTKVTDGKINVKDKMNSGVYEYTITVRYKNAKDEWVEADSDETAAAEEGGKPVIRN